MVWGGETPPTTCLSCYQRLPETCSLSLPPSHTYLAHAAATKRAAAEGTFPHDQTLFVGGEGLMKQNASRRVKSKRVQVVPKAEDAERNSLTEQEAEGRQQSRTPAKTMCV